MSDIKYIYFDVGGVIIDWRPALKAIHEKGGKSIENINDVFHKYEANSSKDISRLLPLFNRGLNLSFSTYEEFVNFYAGAFTPIFQTHALIKKLSASYPISLFSNTEPLVLETSIKLGKIPDIYFQNILASCYEGMKKPDIPFYELARERAGVSHKNILFIDDLERNLISAKSLGWHTLLFDTDSPKESVKKIEDYLISVK